MFGNLFKEIMPQNNELILIFHHFENSFYKIWLLLKCNYLTAQLPVFPISPSTLKLILSLSLITNVTNTCICVCMRMCACTEIDKYIMLSLDFFCLNVYMSSELITLHWTVNEGTHSLERIILLFPAIGIGQ